VVALAVVAVTVMSAVAAVLGWLFKEQMVQVVVLPVEVKVAAAVLVAQMA
jgi:hypothetical protein